MSDKPPDRDVVLNAAFTCAAQGGWIGFSLRDVAREAGCEVGDVEAIFPSREAFLPFFFDAIDRKAKSEACLEDLSSLKDRLMELVLLRLEALGPYKTWCQELHDACLVNPKLACLVSKKVGAYLRFVVEATWSQSPACQQTLFLPGLFLLYGWVFRQWLNDPSQDMVLTLATLDRALTQLLPFLQFL